MNTVIKSWFKWRKANKELSEEKSAFSRNDPQRKSQLSATAAYHTATRRKSHRGPRSCPDDLYHNSADFYCGTLNRSFDSDTYIPPETIRLQRRQQQVHRIRRTNFATSEYGNGDPSSTTLYSTYNRNLDDSDSDSWAAKYERTQHIRDMETRLREQKKKLKEYKERLRVERDLRIVNERSMMEEVEKYKRELRKEQRERKATEQQYIDVIAYMKTKLSLLEHHHPLTQRCPPPLPILSESSINLHKSMPPMPPVNTSEMLYPMVANAAGSSGNNCYDQEIDETKNFRAEETFGEVETARCSEHTMTTCEEPSNGCHLSAIRLTEQDSDDDSNGYMTSCEQFTGVSSKVCTDTRKGSGPFRTSL